MPECGALGRRCTSCVSNLKCSSCLVRAFSDLKPKCFLEDSQPLIIGYSQWWPTCGAFWTCTLTPSKAMPGRPRAAWRLR